MEFSDINKIVKLVKDATQNITNNFCVLCKIAGYSSSYDGLEQHHLAGKINSKPNFHDTLTVCLDCHRYLSDHQKEWLPTKKKKSSKIASYYYGWANIFDLLYMKTSLFHYMKLADKFRFYAYHLRIKFSKLEKH